MAKAPVHGLQETKGEFAFRGIVNGVDKKSFFKETATKKSGKGFKMVNFGLEIDKGKTVYVALNGMEKDKVYFTHKKEDGKYETVDVAWANRKTFKKEGFKLLGTSLGLTKIIDKNGKEINDSKVMPEFDACQYIADNLQDDTSVYVRGKIEHSTYKDKHYTKYVPSQISLCKPIDFSDEDFKPFAEFKQGIVYKSIEKTDDGFIIHGYVVEYSAIEEIELYIKSERAGLAKTLKKLKPYTFVILAGYIDVEQHTETVVDDSGDDWGDTSSNSFTRVTTPTERKLYVTAGIADSVDTSLYSEQSINEGIEKLRAESQANSDYGESSDDDDWGSVDGSTGDDDSDDWD